MTNGDLHGRFDSEDGIDWVMSSANPRRALPNAFAKDSRTQLFRYLKRILQFAYCSLHMCDIVWYGGP